LKKYERTILLALSDTHAGHKLGLCSPHTVLEENQNGVITKYHPQLSETQKYMYEVLEWGTSETIKLAGNDDIVVIHNGDPIQGTRNGFEIMGSRTSDQLLIAIANLETVLKHKNVKSLRFTVGTSIHELGEGSASTIIAETLRAKYPKIDIGVIHHGLASIRGTNVDYAHRGPNIGGRTWLEGNELRYYLRSIMMREIMSGNSPADLFLRGHYHTYRREWIEIRANGKGYESWIVLLPGFTFKDDYTRSAGRSEFKQTTGLVAFEIINGKIYDTHPFIQTIDIRTKETLL
jgi:hypothetical protein